MPPSPDGTPRRAAKLLRIGVDFSGCNAVMHAIENMKIEENTGTRIHHAFDADIDRHCREISKQCYKPNKIYEDVRCREISHMPRTDFLACGDTVWTQSQTSK
jgi:hypothetical protein